MGSITRPTTRFRSCKEAGMVDHAGYVLLCGRHPVHRGCFPLYYTTRDLTFSSRRLHTSRLRPHWRIRRFRRLVLPLPRLSLRHLRAREKRACAIESGNPAIFFPGRRQGGDWLIGFIDEKRRRAFLSVLLFCTHTTRKGERKEVF